MSSFPSVSSFLSVPVFSLKPTFLSLSKTHILSHKHHHYHLRKKADLERETAFETTSRSHEFICTRERSETPSPGWRTNPISTHINPHAPGRFKVIETTLVWRARKLQQPVPHALGSSANPALGHACPRGEAPPCLSTPLRFWVFV